MKMSRSKKKYPVSWNICIRHPSLKMEKRYSNRLLRRNSNNKIKLYEKYKEDELLDNILNDKVIDFYLIGRFDGKFKPFLKSYKRKFSKELLNKIKRK